MNRTIKFRAWDKTFGKMIAVNVLEWQKFTSEDSVCYVKGEFKNSLLSKTYEFQTDSTTIKNINLMQFTGLLDKLGKEIYEGDIVQWKRGSGKEVDIINEVIEIPETFYQMSDGAWTPEQGKIVGNIYANPELLK